MNKEHAPSFTLTPFSVIWLATCAGFGLNVGWYALDAIGQTAARLARLLWG